MDTERRVLRPAGFVPVEAKLRPTLRREGLVRRGHLLDRLFASRDVPVVLITAPAGYGKTVLVDQWSDEDGRAFAWLCVDETDNDPVVLVTYLMLALNPLAPVDTGILEILAADDELMAEAVLPRLGAMLRARETPFVLVLDDVAALTSSVADGVVATVAESLPAGSQLVLLGRRRPSLDWEELRARQRLLELGTGDLRLRRAEAIALVKEGGLRPADDDIDRLLERTEGWAAAVYLTTLAPSSRAAVPTAGAESQPGGDVVGDYVRDEVLAGVTDEDRLFLRRLSVLSHMSGPLCDATLGAGGSEETLRRLEGANILIEPVGDRFLRMHPLLAGALRAELLREEPQLLRLLHTRASRWLEDHGEPDEAIEHAIVAGEVDRAARLIWSRVPACLGSGRLAQLETWLESFTPHQIAGHAKLALTAATCTLQRGGSPDHWVTSAEHGTFELARPGESASVAGATALLRGALARDGVVQMRADARLAIALLEPDDPWLCTGHVLAAISTYLTGDPATAVGDLEEVERFAEKAGAYQCGALALTELALIAVDDDVERARDLAERAYALSEEHGLQGLMTLIPLQCLRAYLAGRDGRSHAALEATRRCITRLAVLMHPPAWLGVQCRHLLARTHLLLGDQAAARTLLSEAQTLLADVADAPVLRDGVDRTWREVEALPLDIRGGASTLTTAELRVLQYLPTHLSFEEIGRQLFVSRNTVKTQAVAAYRKLGVSSRTEAVERAQALGLIAR